MPAPAYSGKIEESELVCWRFGFAGSSDCFAGYGAIEVDRYAIKWKGITICEELNAYLSQPARKYVNQNYA